MQLFYVSTYLDDEAGVIGPDTKRPPSSESGSSSALPVIKALTWRHGTGEPVLNETLRIISEHPKFYLIARNQSAIVVERSRNVNFSGSSESPTQISGKST